MHFYRRITSGGVAAAFLTAACLSVSLQSITRVLRTAAQHRSLEACHPQTPSLLIVVLTFTRHASLSRLLSSLARADYGCAQVDLHINLDHVVSTSSGFSSVAASRCLKRATRFSWPHGQKWVFRRISHVGLSQSWFEVPYATGHDYVAIFEDDMEVHRDFFKVFSWLDLNGSFSSQNIQGFCLHPNDWDVQVDTACEQQNFSKFLYLSPEPCNWGPIWKYKEWEKYIDWVHTLKASSTLPFVPEDISLEYNDFIRANKDVQSSWVWRYNFEKAKLSVRYSFARRDVRQSESYLAINHKEPGVHFAQKMKLHNTPGLLKKSVSRAFHSMSTDLTSFKPSPFCGYGGISHLGADKLG